MAARSYQYANKKMPSKSLPSDSGFKKIIGMKKVDVLPPPPNCVSRDTKQQKRTPIPCYILVGSSSSSTSDTTGYQRA
jgi:hypothetical protein